MGRAVVIVSVHYGYGVVAAAGNLVTILLLVTLLWPTSRELISREDLWASTSALDDLLSFAIIAIAAMTAFTLGHPSARRRLKSGDFATGFFEFVPRLHGMRFFADRNHAIMFHAITGFGAIALLYFALEVRPLWKICALIASVGAFQWAAIAFHNSILAALKRLLYRTDVVAERPQPLVDQ